ncbi:hypothetical protein TIFTF001_019164 [Ficus carica]|uniref:Aminotransferase class V domain-containing protein n=1 Tax=Ficus carica TaxID=3494 RepID=A0AA88A8J2_FICCA|nr:hypothetical protein TIFTF001_019164 [Ficus carica]
MWFKAMSTSSGGDPQLSFGEFIPQDYPRRPVSKRPIYLNSPVAMQVDPHILNTMMPFFTVRFGNPHSQFHFYGMEAKDIVELTRGQAYKEKRHIMTMQTEDESVLYSCRHLEIKEGIEVTYHSVRSDEVVDVEKLKSLIRLDTNLVSNSAVNDELGVIQLMEEIGAICKEFEVPFHTNASYALGKNPINVKKWNVGLVSLCGDLVYGPKGIGALYPYGILNVSFVARILNVSFVADDGDPVLYRTPQVTLFTSMAERLKMLWNSCGDKLQT